MSEEDAQARAPDATGRPGSILFLCAMNAIRSPMAEAIARHMLPRSVYVASAGIDDGERDPFVEAVLTERGIPLEERPPRRLDDLEDDFFDLVVTLAPDAHDVALRKTRGVSVQVENWAVPDPSQVQGRRDQILDAYRDLADRIAGRIAERFPRTGTSDSS